MSEPPLPLLEGLSSSIGNFRFKQQLRFILCRCAKEATAPSLTHQHMATKYYPVSNHMCSKQDLDIFGGLTSHAFGYRLIFAVCSWTWWNSALEVPPHSNVSEAFVKLMILEVLSRKNTNSTRRIHQIIERDGTRATVFCLRFSLNRSSRVGQFVLAGELSSS